MKSKPTFQLIDGRRNELEHEFVRSIFTNDNERFKQIKKQLKGDL